VQRDAQAQGQNEHSTSAWVCARDDGLYVLRDNVHLSSWMYASTVPCAYVHPIPIPDACLLPSSAPRTHRHLTFPFLSPRWDASMGILAATQDPEVSARLDAIVRPLLSPDHPEVVKVTRGSACCRPNPVVRMCRACSAYRAATRLRAGPCSAYRVRLRA
jgi:hypothetical protein